jgi:hypothetical protein
MYSLAFSKIINDDVYQSYTYIKETLEAPKAAGNLIEELIDKLNYLKETPYGRPLVQDKYLYPSNNTVAKQKIKCNNEGRCFW